MTTSRTLGELRALGGALADQLPVDRDQQLALALPDPLWAGVQLWPLDPAGEPAAAAANETVSPAVDTGG